MPDKRFRDVYVLITEFSNRGSVVATIKGEKLTDTGEMGTRARAVLNKAYHTLSTRCAPNTPFSWIVPSSRYREVLTEVGSLDDDVKKFNLFAAKKGHTRSLVIRVYASTLVEGAAYDRIVTDVVERLRSARECVSRGDFHQYRLDMQRLQNIDTILTSPLDHQFNAAIRELKQNRDVLYDAVRSPARPSDIPEGFREDYRLNPAAVLARMLEWPAFDKSVKTLEDTCS